ncbi:MAG: SGNH/GDSL hydrolase family protein, partial [Oscillospiraceae bacterium]|nr:SGNH/GDSL hydrolase family protein [Oscillospiraceae bacterium]
MKSANYIDYLNPVTDELAKHWPANKTINIICHGHSVPAGYFATPFVNAFESYPHLLHRILKERFPFAVINVIVTAIGGEHSADGAKRFEPEVLNHNPSVVTIDYSLNDRGIGEDAARAAWEGMIEKAVSRNVKVILLTPSWDNAYYAQDENWRKLEAHAAQVRMLAEKHGVGLADAFMRFKDYVKNDSDLVALLSHGNHPS